MDEQGVQNFANQIHTFWVEPELKRRWPDGVPPEFRIKRCLVRLPQNKPPIVEFNDEVGLVSRVKMGDKYTDVRAGDPIYVHQIEAIETVLRPEVDGDPVAFVLLWFVGNSWKVIFDFTPNHDDIVIPKNDEDWDLGKTLASHFTYRLAEVVMAMPDDAVGRLLKFGLCPSPAIIPYPLSRINYLLEQNNWTEAETCLLNHCTNERMQQIVNSWQSIPAFELRKSLFHEAVGTYEGGYFMASIHLLLPQVEGVVTDWLVTNVPENEIAFRQESKTKKLRDVLKKVPDAQFLTQKAIDHCITFILDGPVLQTFKTWSAKSSENFPSRNPVLHGKFEAELFNKINAIKAFLLMDALASILRK